VRLHPDSTSIGNLERARADLRRREAARPDPPAR
jgi:hypothetical protein